MKWRRQRWTRQPRSLSAAIDHRHRQLRLQADVLGGADVAQECERLRVTAEEDVLAVVDQFAGDAIAERRRAPAETRARLEHEDARAAPREPRRRAEPRE